MNAPAVDLEALVAAWVAVQRPATAEQARRQGAQQGAGRFVPRQKVTGAAGEADHTQSDPMTDRASHDAGGS